MRTLIIVVLHRGCPREVQTRPRPLVGRSGYLGEARTTLEDETRQAMQAKRGPRCPVLGRYNSLRDPRNPAYCVPLLVVW